MSYEAWKAAGERCSKNLGKPFAPKPGRWYWSRSARALAGRAESLSCGEIYVADLWVMANGIHWEIHETPELGLRHEGGVYNDQGEDRVPWSEDGFGSARVLVNDRVREAVPAAVLDDDDRSMTNMFAHLVLPRTSSGPHPTSPARRRRR